MEIHPDAKSDHFENELTEIVDYEREQPNDWRRPGKLRSINVSEHNEKVLKDALLDVQNTCLPTINHLHSEKNIAQLQERVYQRMLPHIDALNICLLRSRTAAEGDWCFGQFKSNMEGKFKPELKSILLEY